VQVHPLATTPNTKENTPNSLLAPLLLIQRLRHNAHRPRHPCPSRKSLNNLATVENAPHISDLLIHPGHPLSSCTTLSPPFAFPPTSPEYTAVVEVVDQVRVLKARSCGRGATSTSVSADGIGLSVVGMKSTGVDSGFCPNAVGCMNVLM